MEGKRKKSILISALAVVVLGLAALGIGCTLRAGDISLRQAERLKAAGEYLFAAELYMELGDSENADLCWALHTEQQYINSSRLMQQGEYARAIEGFSALDGYKSSARMLDACRFLWAGELMAAGELINARSLYLSLEDYPGLDAALEDCSERIYLEALRHGGSGRLDAALTLFEALGSYRDCQTLARRAERMQAWLQGTERVLDSARPYPNSYYDNVLVNELAYMVLPENAGPECRFLLYYPGGKDDEINIDFLLYYLMNPAPDTVAIFLRTNGLYDMQAKNRAALELLLKLSAELGVFPRELVTAGSSLGAYPAMHSAIYSPADFGLEVSCVLSLDAGDDWNSPYALSAAQCREAAEYGTDFYLFESPWVGTDRPAIRRMVDSGNNVILVGCEFDEHVRITLDAMGMGVIHWALGDRTEPCPLDIYTFSKLYT